MSSGVLLVTHPRRPEALRIVGDVVRLLSSHGVDVRAVGEEAEAIRAQGVQIADADGAAPAEGLDLVLVLGGDGTILRGAEFSRAADIPLLGINLGHVGFLAEAEREDLDTTVERIVAGDWLVEERMTLQVRALSAGRAIAQTWALNEATVEKASRERMIELALEVDDRPLATWGCDGIVVATPTGSTAYAFSAGGPVVWPGVEAILAVPISAHALFARPLVLGPSTRMAVEIVPDSQGAGVLWCDGRRAVELPAGARVEVCRSDRPVRLARLSSSPFTDRLVRKFDLNVAGWRGSRASAVNSDAPPADSAGRRSLG